MQLSLSLGLYPSWDHSAIANGMVIQDRFYYTRFRSISLGYSPCKEISKQSLWIKVWIFLSGYLTII